MRKLIGWLSILLSLFSLAPSLLPGAMSLIGYLISMAALVLSIISVERNNSFYYKATLVIVVSGILVVNDTLRLFGSIPDVPVVFKISFYLITTVLVLMSLHVVKKRSDKI